MYIDKYIYKYIYMSIHLNIHTSTQTHTHTHVHRCCYALLECFDMLRYMQPGLKVADNDDALYIYLSLSLSLSLFLSLCTYINTHIYTYTHARKVADNDDEFEKIVRYAGSKAVIVDFAASWCGPCKVICISVYLYVCMQGDCRTLVVDAGVPCKTCLP